MTGGKVAGVTGGKVAGVTVAALIIMPGL